MLSEDHLSAVSNHTQDHDHHERAEDESKAVARELLTSETNIFNVQELSPLEEIVEDILAGTDQSYPKLSPNNTACHEEADTQPYNIISDDSDSSVDTPTPRRKDSIMASKQAPRPKEAQDDVGDLEQTAAQRVLGTYELLENILLHLPTPIQRSLFFRDVKGLKTILLSQRVNKTFHHVIQRSTKLQEQLFFKYRPTKGSELKKIAWNPLLQHPANPEDLDYYSQLNFEGFVKILSDGIQRAFKLSLPSSYHGGQEDDERRPSYESWRRMFVCQGEALDSQLDVLARASMNEASDRGWECDDFMIGAKTTMGQIWDKVCAEREWKLQ